MKKPTYEQIAAETGFSIATISRCFKNNTNVKEDTRNSILAAASRLGMDLSFLSEMRKKSKLIIFNIPSMDNPLYSTKIKGARAEAERQGYDLLTNECHIRPETLDSVLSLLKRTNAAGLITANHIDLPVLKKLRESIPLVQCCECIEDYDAPYVTIDDVVASEQATNYLLSIGRKRIVLLNGPIQYKYAKKRREGFFNALKKTGIKEEDILEINFENVSFDTAVAVTMQLLNSENRPDAFLTISDVYAAAAIKAAIKNGLTVPKDISVVGFDNIEFAAFFTPAITTVSQPMLKIGTLCSDMLIKEIDGEQYSNRKIYLDTELIIRESTSAKK